MKEVTKVWTPNCPKCGVPMCRSCQRCHNTDCPPKDRKDSTVLTSARAGMKL